jgi:hypothetical protein
MITLPLRGGIKTTDDVEQGRFARPGRPHQRRELALLEMQVYVVHGMHGNGVRVVHLADVVDVDDCFFHVF